MEGKVYKISEHEYGLFSRISGDDIILTKYGTFDKIKIKQVELEIPFSLKNLKKFSSTVEYNTNDDIIIMYHGTEKHTIKDWNNFFNVMKKHLS